MTLVVHGYFAISKYQLCQDIQEKLAFQILPNNLAKDDIFDHDLKQLDILLIQKIVNAPYTRRNPPKCN
jgi:hypothetical protein